ncbi:MAG: hypothetical protein WCS65_11315 [Verrucomicrobiae bacterium]
MAANKAELLLAKFEENVSLENFFLDQSDRDSLVKILGEQEDLLPELLRQMKLQPREGLLWARLKVAADARLVHEKRVADLLGEISRELGRLRQSSKRLHDWQKAWRPPEGHGARFAGTYA